VRPIDRFPLDSQAQCQRSKGFSKTSAGDGPSVPPTDKAHSHAKVIREFNVRLRPEDAIRHIDQKDLNNWNKSDHAGLK